MRIILYGGSFDPVHNEHVQMVECAMRSLHADKAIVLPTYISPFKLVADNTVGYRRLPTARERFEMVRLAFAHLPNVEVNDFEILQKGTSYTYLTCEHFASLYPNDELYFLMGTDSLASFHYWKESHRITACVKIALGVRYAHRENIAALQADFYNRFGEHFAVTDFTGENISSTLVRTVVSYGEDASKYLPPPVYQHILEHSYYIAPIVAKAMALESPERRAHSVRVGLCAVVYAELYGVSAQKALIAAGLHDCAKNLTEDHPLLQGEHIPEGTPKAVAHQYYGAIVAKKLGVIDEDILNAVRYHTSGRPNMSQLEKLIYLSDLLESGRSFPDVEKLRALLPFPDECLKASLAHMIEYFKSFTDVDPLTLQAYEFYNAV